MITFYSLSLAQIFLVISLLIFSYIDIKKRVFPSPLTTGVLFTVAVLNVGNIYFGLLSFILALLLLEMNVFSGLADVKMITAVGLTLTTWNAFMTFALLLLIFNVVYQLMLAGFMKKRIGYQMPFIPVILIAYVTLLILTLL